MIVDPVARIAPVVLERARDHHSRILQVIAIVRVRIGCMLEDRRGRVVGIEIKASATVRPTDLRGLRQLQAAVGDKFVQGLVLHDHDRITPFDKKLHAGPVSLLWQGLPG